MQKSVCKQTEFSKLTYLCDAIPFLGGIRANQLAENLTEEAFDIYYSEAVPYVGKLMFLSGFVNIAFFLDKKPEITIPIKKFLLSCLVTSGYVYNFYNFDIAKQLNKELCQHDSGQIYLAGENNFIVEES